MSSSRRSAFALPVGDGALCIGLVLPGSAPSSAGERPDGISSRLSRHETTPLYPAVYAGIRSHRRGVRGYHTGPLVFGGSEGILDGALTSEDGAFLSVCRARRVLAVERAGAMRDGPRAVCYSRRRQGRAFLAPRLP